MPKSSHADQMDEWRSVLAGLDSQLEELNDPYIRKLRDLLASMIQAVKDLAAEQNHLQARRQAVTQQLRITKSETQDLVIKIRSAVKGRLGHRNEGLVRYRMRPNRGRPRAQEEAVGIKSWVRPDLRPEALAKGEPAPETPADET